MIDVTLQDPDPANVPSSMTWPCPRERGSRPELLDRLPSSLLTSPAMIAVGGVFVFLYGIVLFAVVSDRRNKAELEAKKARESYTVADATLPPVVPLPPTPTRPAPAKSKEARPSGSEATPEKKPEPAPKSIEPAKKSAPKNPDSTPRAKAAMAKTRPPGVKPEPPPPPPPPLNNRIETWGSLAGIPGDCQFLVEGTGLTIGIPGVLHVLSPELNVRNSPKLLTDVRGDFVAQVKVEGRILPGIQPLPKLPFTYQGAGLLLWVDDNNYLRLERSSSFFTAEGKRLHQVMLELCRDGKTVPAQTRDVREHDLILKFDRRGSEVRCSYSPDDGRTWLEMKRQAVNFPSGLSVGVSASNASPKPFAARLDGFSLSGPAAKTAEGGATAPGSSLSDRR
jgi:regulation of enolase protein 1 (concanavalin A-like superfamily)